MSPDLFILSPEKYLETNLSPDRYRPRQNMSYCVSCYNGLWVFYYYRKGVKVMKGMMEFLGAALVSIAGIAGIFAVSGKKKDKNGIMVHPLPFFPGSLWMQHMTVKRDSPVWKSGTLTA